MLVLQSHGQRWWWWWWWPVPFVTSQHYNLATGMRRSCQYITTTMMRLSATINHKICVCKEEWTQHRTQTRHIAAHCSPRVALHRARLVHRRRKPHATRDVADLLTFFRTLLTRALERARAHHARHSFVLPSTQLKLRDPWFLDDADAAKERGAINVQLAIAAVHFTLPKLVTQRFCVRLPIIYFIFHFF